MELQLHKLSSIPQRLSSSKIKGQTFEQKKIEKDFPLTIDFRRTFINAPKAHDAQSHQSTRANQFSSNEKDISSEQRDFLE